VIGAAVWTAVVAFAVAVFETVMAILALRESIPRNGVALFRFVVAAIFCAFGVVGLGVLSPVWETRLLLGAFGLAALLFLSGFARTVVRGIRGPRLNDRNAATAATEDRDPPTLRFLRRSAFGVVASFVMFFVVLALMAPLYGGHSGWYGVVVAAWGAFALGVIRRTLREPLDTSSLGRLARAYSESTFIGLGLAQSVVLVSFVGVFVTNALWVYIEGLAISLIGAAWVAPTASNLERRQRQIAATGSHLLLRDALEPKGKENGQQSELAGPE